MRMRMAGRDWAALLGFIALAEAAGLVGLMFTASALGPWYDTLIKPVLNPPAEAFGPVWTWLFVLMGISGFLVW